MTKNILIMGNSADFCREVKALAERAVPPAVSVSILPQGCDPVSVIQLSVPEIVITETRLAGMSCFDVMQRVTAMRNNTTQFVICGERDFECVYRALKAGAIDYLLLPVIAESLAATISRIISSSEGYLGENAARRFYLNDRGIDVLRREPTSLEQVNTVYSTHFVPGVYRMIFAKFDVPYFHKTSSANIELNIDYIERTLRDIFDEYCADIVTIRKADGIMAVLNYKPVYSSGFDQKIHELYNHLKYANGALKTFDITLCISEEIDDPCEVWKIKEQVRDAEWSRMELGVNRIIYWQSFARPLDDQKVNQLDKMLANVIRAISVLDIDRFRSGIHEMYSMPREFLLSREFRFAIKKIIYYPYEIYWDTISKFSDPTENADTLAFLSHLCTSFTSHENLIISEYTKLLENIAQYAEDKYSPAVTAVIDYISRNTDKRISLASAAAEVHLSECYLSYLFKKETGVNFSKYVSNYKSEAADNMLADTKLTISEIACRLGFNNVQAFSKRFKTLNGITPSKYRQLHSTIGDGKGVPRKKTTQSDAMMR